MAGGRRTKVATASAVVVAGAAGVTLTRIVTRRREAARSASEPRWQAVTINRPPEEVMGEGRPPEPLAGLGDLVDVEVRPAPGGRGAELRARLRSTEPAGAAGAARRLAGTDPRQRVRSALREAKQLIEVGEVLRLEPVPHGRRPPTPGGKLIDFATRRAAGEGLL